MKWKPATERTALYVVATVILLIGLGSAVLIHFSVEAGAHDSAIRDFENSKRYRHDLEVIGGKMNVLMDQFCRWFAALWQGESLAVTIAWLTVFIAFGIFLFARHLPTGAAIDGQQPESDSGANPP